MATDRYAVFGQPISHSKSPRIHQFFAQQTGQNMAYTAEEVPPEQFADRVRFFFAQGGCGLNCTVPLKELAFAFADLTTERAQRAKAVNTLVRKDDGSVLGDNTDGAGLVTDLTANRHIRLAGQRVLVLGAGGATRGILQPLLDAGPQCVQVVNRTLDKAQSVVAEFSQPKLSACSYGDLDGQIFDLIVNATSASLAGDLPPLPPKLLADGGACYDLAYSDAPTAFVGWGQAQQAAQSLDGLGMLVEQAAEAFCLWRGVRPPTQMLLGILERERGER